MIKLSPAQVAMLMRMAHGDGTDMTPRYDRGAWMGCPTCGAALLWCEAGFVPGWRICLGGHAVQLSEDGRVATRHPEQDAATLRSTRPL